MAYCDVRYQVPFMDHVRTARSMWSTSKFLLTGLLCPLSPDRSPVPPTSAGGLYVSAPSFTLVNEGKFYLDVLPRFSPRFIVLRRSGLLLVWTRVVMNLRHC